MASNSLLFFSLLSLSMLIGQSSSQECPYPEAAADFSNTRFAGVWFEVGKIQTPGGAALQQNLKCTTATFSPYDPDSDRGDCDVVYRSINATTDEEVFIEGTLEDLSEGPAGHFLQTLTFLGQPGPPVEFHVVSMDEQYLLQFDCFLTEYCVHILVRDPSNVDQATIDELVTIAENLELNPLGMSYDEVVQDCQDHQ